MTVIALRNCVRLNLITIAVLAGSCFSDAQAQAPVELSALASIKRILQGAPVSLVADREARTEREEIDLAARLGVEVKQDPSVLECTKKPGCGPTLPPGVLLLSVSSKTIRGAFAEVVVQLLSRETSPRVFVVRLERTKNNWKVISLSATVS